MLLGAAILALVLGTAVSAPWYPGSSGHQINLNPRWQGRSSLTQGFLCDWCIVGVQDVQDALRENLNEIGRVLNRTSRLCAYCPVQAQCEEYFLTEIPEAINEILSQSPNDICYEAGLCNENQTLPGMVMNNLNGHVARDRVIKRMLMRARIMQQKMIRLILGPDYLCTACQDFVADTRELLLDNETQFMIMDFLSPLCDYMPTEYQTECAEFVQSIPALMTMLANEVLTDSTCSDLGFCNKTKEAEPEPGLPDIFSQLGLPGILPVMPGKGQNQNPFQFPGTGNNRQNPWQFPGQSRPGQNPFGLPSRPGQNPFGVPSLPGQGRPGQGRPGQGRPGQSRPGQGRPGQSPLEIPSQPRPRPQHPIGKWPTSTNSRPDKPQNPKPKITPKPVKPVPDFNLEDIFGGNTGVLDRLPSIPEMPELRIPGLSIRIPGSRRSDQSRRQQGRGGRRQRSVPDWKDIEKLIPNDKVHEYIPDPIPEAGITITEKGADEDCEVCKLAVMAVDSWLQNNAPELQKMVSKLVQPVCELFPSPMKEDCVSDVSEFVQTFIQTLVSNLQPEPVCTWLTICGTAKEEVPYFPTAETPGVEPTTWPLLP